MAAFVAATPLPVHAEEPTPTELDVFYEKAFGKPADQVSIVAPLPTRINGRAGDDLPARFRPTDPQSLHVSGALVRTLLDPILAPRARAELQTLVEGEDWTSAASLAQLGIEASLDETTLEVILTVPPALLLTQIRDTGGAPPEAAGALGPATVSAYLTARVAGRFYWQDEPDAPRPHEGRADLASAIQVHGVVFEGRVVADSTAEPLVRRTSSRAVVDDRDHALRYVAGDFSVPYMGLHDSMVLMGLNVARNFALQPYTPFRLVGRFEFFLEQRSLVHIYLNDALVESVQLDAGTHDIRKLALSPTANNVRVVIVDSTGGTRTLDFSMPVSNDLLAKGVHQYSYGVGFLPSLGASVYDWKNPTASLTHRIGVSPTLTVQAYGAANPTDQIVGAGVAVATRFGNVSVDLGAGHATDTPLLPAARIRYDLAKVRGSSTVLRSVRIGVEYRPITWGRFGSIAGEPLPVTTTASVTQQLGSFRATLDALHQFGGSVPLRDASSAVRLGISGRLRAGIGSSAWADYTYTKPSGSEWAAGLTLTSRLGRTRQSVRAALEASSIHGVSEMVTWSQVTPWMGAGTQSSVTFANAENTQGVRAHAELSTSRGTIGMFHEFEGDRFRNDPISHVTEVYAASALAFADGLVGLSSPIDGSFLLVGRRHRMKGQLLQVNPARDRAVSRADLLGAAVLPNLNAYRLAPITLAAPNLPIGYELGPQSYALVPGYRTGTAIRIGSEASIVVKGTLFGPDGAPLAFVTGQVTSTSDPTAPPWVTFTNGAGVFFIEGLTPGRYELTLFDEERAPVDFTLGPQIVGLHDMGPVHVQPRGDEAPSR